MINLLQHFYNIEPTNIKYSSNKCFFYYRNYVFYFFSIDNLNKVMSSYDLSIYLLSNNFYCHSFVFNIDNEIYTFYDGKYYILLRCLNFNNIVLGIDSLKYFYNSFYLFSDISVSKIRLSFIERVDYFEYEAENFKIQYPLIYNSFKYFIGLAENAIQLLLSVKNIKCSISHFDYDNFSNYFEFYNPLNFIIDCSSRDLSIYVQNKFFLSNFNFSYIRNYILYFINNLDDAIVFFSRLLFPSYYFRMCDSIFYNSVSENVISSVLNKVFEYECFLSDVYDFLSIYFHMPYIDWLKKKN